MLPVYVETDIIGLHLAAVKLAMDNIFLLFVDELTMCNLIVDVC